MIRKKLLLLILLDFLTGFIFAKAILPDPCQVNLQLSAKSVSVKKQPVTINLVDLFSNSLLTNLPPVANAGADTTLVLPTDMVTLNGCSSSDPEMADLSFKWTKISGPGAFLLREDSLCSVRVNGLVEGTYSFELTVTDIDGLSGKDTVVVTVNSSYSSNWPPQYTPLCNKPYKIVVIGSSTAFGKGATPIDSSWVNKFAAYLGQQNAQVSLINLASVGYTSYHLPPTGTVVPSNWSIIVDTMRNITKALSLNPDAIIMNLPSNDIDFGFSFSEIQFNYNRIKAAADSQHVPIWITTTQPRNMTASKRLLQMDLRDWIMNSFDKKAVDFWSTISNPDGTIKQSFDYGDGIHPNNAGHHVLFTRIVDEMIWDTLCTIKNLQPVANAGRDTLISGIPAVLTLDGSGSYDVDGTVLRYSWRILNNSSGTITGANTVNPVFSTSTPMDYAVELELTDNLGGDSKDTIIISVTPAAVLTYNFTGNGNWNEPSNWTNNLVPPAILSGNALIIIDPVVNGECVLNTSQKLVNGAILKVMENKKFRIEGSFELIQ